MSHQVVDILLSLLPERYRRRYQVNPVAGTFLSGTLQMLVALAVYVTLFFRFLNQFGPLAGAAVATDMEHNLYWLSMGVGVVGWLAFSISPGPLLAMYFMLEGGVRMLSTVIAQEPLPSLPFWLFGEVHGWVERRWARRRLAPPAPDLVELRQPGAAWDLRVTSVRPKSNCRSLVQVEYNGELYHISSSATEVVDGQARFRCYLKRSTAVGAFRGIVRYDPFEYWKPDGS